VTGAWSWPISSI